MSKRSVAIEQNSGGIVNPALYLLPELRYQPTWINPLAHPTTSHSSNSHSSNSHSLIPHSTTSHFSIPHSSIPHSSIPHSSISISRSPSLSPVSLEKKVTLLSQELSTGLSVKDYEAPADRILNKVNPKTTTTTKRATSFEQKMEFPLLPLSEQEKKEKEDVKLITIEGQVPFYSIHCPECRCPIHILKSELNCYIFRCGVNLNPHASKETCLEKT